MSHEKYKLIKQINQIHGTQLDSEIREKQKKKNFDPNKQTNDKMKYNGRKWCFDGHDLKDASEELRNNPSFVEGYEAAMNLNIQSYDEGFRWFIDEKRLGISKTIPEHYQNNIYWMQGYRDAVHQSLIDGIDWTNLPSDLANEDCFDFNEEKDSSSSHRHR